MPDEAGTLAVASICPISGPGNPFAHVWHAHELPYIQPVDYATADSLQSKRFLSSPRRLAAWRGIDFGDLTEEIVADHVIEAGAFQGPGIPGSEIPDKPLARTVLCSSCRCERIPDRIEM